MKRVLFAGMVCLLALVSCHNEHSFRIEGVAEGVEDGTMVRLRRDNGSNWETFDSTVVTDGKFVFEGQVDPDFMASVETESERAYVMVEPGKISVDIKNRVVGGTELNEKLQKFYEDGKELEAEAMKLMPLCEAGDSAAMVRMDELYEQDNAMTVSLIKENIGNGLGLGMLRRNLYVVTDDVKLLEELRDGIDEKYQTQAYVQFMTGVMNTVIETSVSKKFVDFEVCTTDGVKTTLGEMVKANKFVLIDFWASWCAPCRASLPGVKALYDEYKEQGLEILGVSLDGDETAWKGAIEKYEMTWPQMSDLKGWQSEYASLYGVMAIPATVLITNTGMIVGRNLELDEIKAFFEFDE